MFLQDGRVSDAGELQKLGCLERSCREDQVSLDTLDGVLDSLIDEFHTRCSLDTMTLVRFFKDYLDK